MTGNPGDGDGTGTGRAGSPAGDAGLHATRRNVLKATGAAAAGTAIGAGVPGLSSALTIENTPVPIERESRNSNLIVDPQGEKVKIRGVNIVDPYRSARDAPYYKYRGERLTQLATNAENGWHSKCIRVPMQPNDIARAGAGSVPAGAYSEEQLESYCRKYVDPIVEECAFQGVYCILDYHRHWPSGPMWTEDALDEEIKMFWNLVAARYADWDHVIFEVYNEPTEPYAGYEIYNGGPDVTDPESEETWLKWKDHAQPWVDTIREHSGNLCIIGSPRWSQWTYWAANSEEFEGENLGYVGHIYTQENMRPLSTYFGEPSKEVPVWMTEFGWGGDAPYLAGSTEKYGPQFHDLVEGYDGIHWTAWCFDFDWGPPMFSDREYSEVNEYGQWVKDTLAENSDQDQPYDPTAGTTPPSSVSGLQATSVGDTAVEIDWEPVDGADGYTVYGTQALMGSVEEPPVVVGNLTPGSIEWLGVVAYNAGGASPYVEIEVNTMAEGEGADVSGGLDTVGLGDDGGAPDDREEPKDPVEPPTSPGDQWTNEVTSTSIDLGWDPVEGANSYVVYVNGTEYDATSSTSMTITGLSPATDYEVGIQSSNAAGTSEMVTTTITTMEGTGEGPTCGGEPVNATASVDGRTVCDVNGDGLYRDVDANGAVSHADVQEFFSVQHRPTWKQPGMFDFNDNDVVGHGDVVALFEDIATGGL